MLLFLKDPTKLGIIKHILEGQLLKRSILQDEYDAMGKTENPYLKTDVR